MSSEKVAIKSFAYQDVLVTKSSIKKLYIMQLQNDGISDSDYAKLTQQEQKYLEKRGKKYWIAPAARAKIIVVATGGAFDILHLGHIKTLEAAKKLGDVLIVIIAKDYFIEKKGRKPAHSQAERMAMVNALRTVDLAIAGGENPIDTAKRISPDIIAFGYDQKLFTVKGIKSVKLGIAYRTQEIKTSKLISNGG